MKEGKGVKKLSIALLVAAAAVGLMVSGAAGKGAKTTATGTQVCVLLPDTTSSPRWQQFDKPAFINAFKKAGLTAAVVNALNQPQKQLAQAEQCINNGAKVGIITSLDTGTSIAIQKKFTAAGGKTIDYDRQIVGGTGSVYISFDGNQVGRIQARGVIAGMVAKKTYGPKAVVAQLWGGPTDANAFWFKSGNDDVLNPLFKVKKITKGPAKFVPDWDAKNAQTIFEQMLVQTNNNIQGVVGANDNIAGAVVATLKAKGLKPIPLSGQDATVQGVQNIISGWQTNTVYKYVPDEANAAAAAAVALFNGKKPKTNATRPNGSKKQPTLVIPVVSITKANYTRLFKDKFLKRSDVCSGQYKQYCK
jgi:D-xylose transport system substrate-binding protein